MSGTTVQERREYDTTFETKIVPWTVSPQRHPKQLS